MRSDYLLATAILALATTAAAKDKPAETPSPPPEVIRVGKDPFPSQYK